MFYVKVTVTVFPSEIHILQIISLNNILQIISLNHILQIISLNNILQIVSLITIFTCEILKFRRSQYRTKQRILWFDAFKHSSGWKFKCLNFSKLNVLRIIFLQPVKLSILLEIGTFFVNYRSFERLISFI